VTINLQALNNPPRFDEIARLHVNALNWRSQGRIPLGIHVVNPEYARGLSYADWLNPEPFFEYQIKMLADTLAVGSDLLPHVAINHLGNAVLTSMFGAAQFMPEGSSASLQDVGPTPLPVFSAIEETEGLALPSLDAGIMPQVRRLVQYYRERLPKWVHVVAPMPSGPFSTALELRGFDFLMDMVERPDLAARLIETCARLQVEVETDIRRLTGEPLDRHVSNFGVMGAGLRLGDDSMVNLSPAMIRDFCLPAFDLVNRRMGGKGHIHFCSLPHSRFEQIYPAMAAASGVAVVSSQFGFEYYARHLEELRGRLAVESFYGDAYRYVCEKHGSFADWANDFVPRYKNEFGLVLYCTVASVEEGRRLWSIWNQAHNRATIAGCRKPQASAMNKGSWITG